MNKLNLAVLFGGVSSEHEISCKSAFSVLTHLDQTRYTVYPVGITREGQWYLYKGEYDLIPSGKWEEDSLHLSSAILSPDRKTHGLELLGSDSRRSLPLDVVFPVLHGKNGEDGTVQGLLELSGIPYVGVGVLGSAVCMDKGIAKDVFAAANIPQCPYTVCDIGEYESNAESVLADIEAHLSYPMFVKPANAGSSVGISKAVDRAGLVHALAIAAPHDRKIVIEKCVNAREIEVAVMGNNSPIASHPGEILPSNEFYDYKAKYIDGKSGLAIPCDLPADRMEEVRTLAVRAYKAGCCQGLARVDFFLDREDNRFYLNEINTLPGFTDISMFPKLFMHEGLSYGEILDRLIEYALRRNQLHD